MYERMIKLFDISSFFKFFFKMVDFGFRVLKGLFYLFKSTDKNESSLFLSGYFVRFKELMGKSYFLGLIVSGNF